MRKSINKIYLTLREKEIKNNSDLLRGGCNESAQAYLAGMQEAYREAIELIEKNFSVNKKGGRIKWKNLLHLM